MPTEPHRYAIEELLGELPPPWKESLEIYSRMNPSITLVYNPWLSATKQGWSVTSYTAMDGFRAFLDSNNGCWTSSYAAMAAIDEWTGTNT